MFIDYNCGMKWVYNLNIIIYEGAQILLHECHRLMLSLSLSLFCNSHAVVPCAKWFDVAK